METKKPIYKNEWQDVEPHKKKAFISLFFDMDDASNKQKSLYELWQEAAKEIRERYKEYMEDGGEDKEEFITSWSDELTENCTTYTADIFEYYNAHPCLRAYADEAIKVYGPTTDTAKNLQLGIYYFLCEMTRKILEVEEE